jgi:hypothetical protein
MQLVVYEYLKKDFTTLSQGPPRAVQVLREAVDSCLAEFAQRSDALAELPATPSLSFFRSWLDGVKAFSDWSFEQIVDDMCAHQCALATEVGSMCPKWGECLNDDKKLFNAAQLQLMLVGNKAIKALPDKTKELFELMKSFARASRILQLPAANDHAKTKGPAELAVNFLKFARLTVDVAAAIRTLYDKRATDKDIQALVKNIASYPQMLQVLLGKGPDL